MPGSTFTVELAQFAAQIDGCAAVTPDHLASVVSILLPGPFGKRALEEGERAECHGYCVTHTEEEPTEEPPPAGCIQYPTRLVRDSLVSAGMPASDMKKFGAKAEVYLAGALEGIALECLSRLAAEGRSDAFGSEWDLADLVRGTELEGFLPDLGKKPNPDQALELVHDKLDEESQSALDDAA